MTNQAKLSSRALGRRLGCVALLLGWAALSHAQNYDAGRAAAQRAGSTRYQSASRTAPPIQGGYRARAPYQSQEGAAPVNYQRSIGPAASHQVNRAQGYRPSGEVRGNDVVQPVRYQAEVAPQETIIEPSVEEVPMNSTYSAGQPVEIIQEDVVYEDSQESCSSCSSCGSGGGGICDPAYRSHGCNRERCPCPSDEALSYYRCNQYGHYPTLWRSWPEGFLKYRPEPQDTMYDRFRKAPKGMERAGGNKRDEDLDNQLKDLLKEQEATGKGKPATKPTVPGERPAPDLLPDDPPAPEGGPAPGDGSNYRRRPVTAPHAVRPVGWNR